ncbi:hypothetical protein TTHERM_00695830 (macronuclear) [Tetrahymena thermophila SB210]|uniref:Transmembrane protein n=1 Tax=Tetrahymena thermophila (strain SB210) TaxID=312017 RepID=Q24C89_TETTS|nr:hypothetical protein TTHERM_00695830 [Tetrahymena thermophila SB210]EAS05349.2 hypothetical protein TTHERM_00695830 [Tetrahymena thermophila SB210]|eukprot:XP_001025594.2 hypothetical protein TTHERM_00695830 [Tetrahymena thermophila SB210]
MRMRLVIFLALICFCLGQINLRKEIQSNIHNLEQCQKPCLNQIDQVILGAVLGFRSDQHGITFKNNPKKNLIYLCCDQQKTYDFLNGLIVPDFTDVKQLNIEDSNNFEVDIQPFSGDGAKYAIQLNHTFQRIAFQLETNSQLQANMTFIQNEIPEPNKCDNSYAVDNKNWYWVFSSIGESVLTQVQIGSQFDVQFIFTTNQEYTKEEVIRIYQQYIATNNVMTVHKPFDTLMHFISSVVKGGALNLSSFDNFQDYLNNLGPQSYTPVFTENNYKSINSFRIFDKESKDIKKCSFETWNFVKKSEQ